MRLHVNLNCKVMKYNAEAQSLCGDVVFLIKGWGACWSVPTGKMTAARVGEGLSSNRALIRELVVGGGIEGCQAATSSDCEPRLNVGVKVKGQVPSVPCFLL